MGALNAVAAALLLLALLAADAAERPRLDLEGPATYEKSGVRLEDRLHPRKDLSSVTEAPLGKTAVEPKPEAREAFDCVSTI